MSKLKTKVPGLLLVLSLVSLVSQQLLVLHLQQVQP
jgi:hypothetical protein